MQRAACSFNPSPLAHRNCCRLHKRQGVRPERHEFHRQLWPAAPVLQPHTPLSQHWKRRANELRECCLPKGLNCLQFGKGKGWGDAGGHGGDCYVLIARHSVCTYCALRCTAPCPRLSCMPLHCTHVQCRVPTSAHLAFSTCPLTCSIFCGLLQTLNLPPQPLQPHAVPPAGQRLS